MNNTQPLLNALILGGVSMAFYVVSQVVSPDAGLAVPAARAAGATEGVRRTAMDQPPGEGHVVNGRLLRDAFPQVGSLDVAANEVEMDLTSHAPNAQAQSNSESAGYDALMGEASQLMLELYRDGILAASVGIACASSDAQPDAATSMLVLERFREMHRKYDSQLEVVRTLAKDDPAVAAGWNEIRADLSVLRNLAAELRSEKGRTAAKSREGNRTGSSH